MKITWSLAGPWFNVNTVFFSLRGFADCEESTSNACCSFMKIPANYQLIFVALVKTFVWIAFYCCNGPLQGSAVLSGPTAYLLIATENEILKSSTLTEEYNITYPKSKVST